MRPKTLEIRLAGQRVGWLVQRDGRTGIRFDDGWRSRPDRRVLSLSTEHTGLEDIRATPHLPPWFENLLFEGEMRRWIAESEPNLPQDDLSFLARIGDDLIGAATVHTVDDDVPLAPPVELREVPRAEPRGGLHWSLAGVQLKLNLVARDDHYTLPVHGELGHFIGKFADRRFRGVPVNEHATMSWGRAAGIECADTKLIDAAAISELPRGLGNADEPVLLVRRFDRAQGERIHCEELAQALGVRPGDKYRRLGWKHHLALVNEVAPQDVAEYLRKLMFVIATGNADAHHKNWSLLYPDGRQPRLAPAYDQVSVVAWAADGLSLDDCLPFKLAGSKRWEDVGIPSLVRLLDEARVVSFEDGLLHVGAREFPAWITAFLENVLDSLPTATAIAGPRYRETIQRHWARTPLLRG